MDKKQRGRAHAAAAKILQHRGINLCHADIAFLVGAIADIAKQPSEAQRRSRKREADAALTSDHS